MEDVKIKLEKIRNLWNEYFFKLKFFHIYYKFDKSAKSNYLGEILGHFSDSLHLLEYQEVPESFQDRFSYQIALLQTIFVQQDLIEEMYKIFKSNVLKSDLYKDKNYKDNREIRNELIGHPVKRKNGNGKIISTVSLSYNNTGRNIEYARYHISNDYRFEIVKHNVDNIIKRHLIFLNIHLDRIYVHTHKSLRKYLIKIDNLWNVFNTKSFNSLVNCLGNDYEVFKNISYLYETEQILEVYQKKELHPRYKVVLNKYLFDVEYHLKYLKGDIECIINGEEFDFENYPIICNKHHYEMSKLLTKRESQDFSFYEDLLRAQIKDEEVLKELDFLVGSRDNEVDYYSSYYFLNELLKE